MVEIRLALEAENELDGIWLYIARESGSIDIANRVVESITDRFWLMARHPYIGRQRDDDLGAGLRSLTADDCLIIYRIEKNDIVLILHIVPGSRSIQALFSH